MNKYLIYFLIIGGGLTGSYTLGYLKGSNNEKHKSLEAKYQALQNNYIKQVQSESATLSIVESYHAQLITTNDKITKLKEELANEKEYINATNRITTSWLWYVQRATNPETIPETPRRINESPTEVKASSVANGIIDNFKICNDNAVQLEKLQAWVKKQEEIYNAK